MRALMKIHVVGSGAREHALVWALHRAGHELSCAPGNPGIGALARLQPVSTTDIEGQVAAARAHGAELVVVGPEAPLCAGLADALREAGIPCFGPTQAGARLEGSKAFCKQFFARHDIPTADFAVCESMAEVEGALARLGDAVVVKADGLAAGKGVTVCADAEAARIAARAMLEDGVFGAAGRRVIVERRIRGREASIFALTDGERLVILPAVEDHKAVLDGDRGPNTGGMGTVSPTALPAGLVERVRREILQPTVAGLRAEGIDYRGVLFAGIMIDLETGAPLMLEYNCRFGDPEAEPLFARWQDDPAPWLLGAAAGKLPAGEPEFSHDAAVCVVMAAAGYPEAPRAGDEILGLDEAAALPDVTIFHAGTRKDGERLVTAGGRVLAVCALGADAHVARTRAYQAVARIRFEGAHFRRDIGVRSRRETAHGMPVLP
jgi:phosphoribosylamine--glycine ligase